MSIRNPSDNPPYDYTSEGKMNKSVLDGTKKICTNCDRPLSEHPNEFPCETNHGKLLTTVLSMAGTKQNSLSVVGHCPCGAPVYGRKKITADEVPTVRYSCGCREPATADELAGKVRTT